jgi:hypothetical protein
VVNRLVGEQAEEEAAEAVQGGGGKCRRSQFHDNVRVGGSDDDLFEADNVGVVELTKDGNLHEGTKKREDGQRASG